jgi:hypothetical protein
MVINLATGDDVLKDDIAVHIKTLAKENRVVLNSRIGGKWGHEEAFKGMPFQKGADFYVIIWAKPEALMVSFC